MTSIRSIVRLAAALLAAFAPAVVSAQRGHGGGGGGGGGIAVGVPRVTTAAPRGGGMGTAVTRMGMHVPRSFTGLAGTRASSFRPVPRIRCFGAGCFSFGGRRFFGFPFGFGGRRFSPFGFSPFGFSPFGFSPFGFSPFGFFPFGSPFFPFGFPFGSAGFAFGSTVVDGSAFDAPWGDAMAADAADAGGAMAAAPPDEYVAPPSQVIVVGGGSARGSDVLTLTALGNDGVRLTWLPGARAAREAQLFVADSAERPLATRRVDTSAPSARFPTTGFPAPVAYGGVTIIFDDGTRTTTLVPYRQGMRVAPRR